MTTTDWEAAYEQLMAAPGIVFLLGGIDTGKSTFGTELLRRAAEAGIPSAIVDAEIDQSTVGPPTTIGLKMIAPGSAVTREELRSADGLSFVGASTPKGHLLPLVVGTGKLVVRARALGARLVVIDTTGFVSGVHAQSLKFFKMDLVGPDFVVAFERGGELDPLIATARRFTSAEPVELGVPPEVPMRSVEDRMSFREQQLADYFAGASRWRVKPTVFMPTLPPDYDLAALDGLVVGMEDGAGSCVGIGVLDYEPGEDILRMISPVTEGVRGLRLGSLKIDVGGRSRGPVDLRQLLRTE